MFHDIILFAYTASVVSILLFIASFLFKKEVNKSIFPFIFFIPTSILLVLFLSHNIWISFALLFVLFLVSLRGCEPAHIAGILILSILLIPDMQKDIFAGNVRLITVGLSDAMTLGAALIMLSIKKLSKPSKYVDIPIIILTILFIVFESRDTSITNIGRVSLQTFIDILIPYWIVSRSIRSIDDIKTIFLYFIISGLILSSLIAMESILGWTFFRAAVANYGMDPLWFQVKWRSGYLRAAGPFLEPTSMAFGLVILALATWNFRSIFNSNISRYIAFLFIFAGIGMCQSRNAYLGLCIGLLASEVFRRLAKSSTKIWLFPFAALVVSVPSSIFITTSHQSYQESETDETISYRRRLLDSGLREAAKHPIIGSDIVTVKSNMEDMIQGEHIIDFVNSYLYVQLISGIIGLVIFLSILISAPINSIRSISKKSSAGEIEISGYIFAISLSCIQMLLFTYFGGRMIILIMIIVGLSGYLGRIQDKTGGRRSFGGRARVGAILAVPPNTPGLSWRQDRN